MIRFAAPGDRSQLKALWQDAFGDGREAVDYYFSQRHEDRNMLVRLEGGTVAAMLSMLPVALMSGDAALPGRYVYAVATAGAYRGRGFSTELLDRAHRVMEEENTAASLLVPAEKSLFRFYQKRGYTAAFFIEELELGARDLPPPPPGAGCVPCGAEEYLRLRDQAFSGSRLYARWDAGAVAYALGSEEASGGGALRFSDGRGAGCALYSRDGSRVIVKELALAGMEVRDAASLLHSVLGAEIYTLRLRESSLPGAQVRPFGMIRYLRDPPAQGGGTPYLGLVLD